MNRIDRLLGYLLMLQSRNVVRAQDLATRFGVSERTVYRDMDALAEIGVPLVGQAGEGYRLMEGYSLPPVMFNEGEARALFLAIAMLTGLAADGPTKAAAATARAKVRAILPPALRDQVEQMQAILGFHAVARPPLNLDDDNFIRLQAAINDQQVVLIYYHALHSNRITAREVEPLRLAFVDQAWIMHGFCRLRQDHRNFRLDRIDRLTVKSEHFTPRSVQIARLPEDGQLVRVRFAAEIIRWVREAQHFTYVETLAEDEEGNAVMVYNVADITQFQRWLLRWGEGMEVLEPATLRAEIAISARKVAEHHQARL